MRLNKYCMQIKCMQCYLFVSIEVSSFVKKDLRGIFLLLYSIVDYVLVSKYVKTYKNRPFACFRMVQMLRKHIEFTFNI